MQSTPTYADFLSIFFNISSFYRLFKALPLHESYIIQEASEAFSVIDACFVRNEASLTFCSTPQDSLDWTTQILAQNEIPKPKGRTKMENLPKPFTRYSSAERILAFPFR